MNHCMKTISVSCESTWLYRGLNSTGSKTNSVHFSLKISHLVTTVLIIFPRIDWPNFVRFTPFKT